MKPLVIGNVSIPPWLIISIVIIGVGVFLMIFNDITFERITDWLMDKWKEAKR